MISRVRTLSPALFALFVAVVFLLVRTVPLGAQTTRPGDRPEKADQHDDSRFLRFVGDGTKGGMLETSEAVYKNADGVTVRLVSAVHIGEPAYFHDIQLSFQKCDAVLYEMVKPRDSGPPQKGVHSDSAVSKLQRFLKDRLD